MTTTAPRKLHSIQIERLTMGGYMILSPGKPSQPVAAYLAACTTLGEVLDFVTQNMEESADPKAGAKP